MNSNYGQVDNGIAAVLTPVRALFFLLLLLGFFSAASVAVCGLAPSTLSTRPATSFLSRV